MQTALRQTFASLSVRNFRLYFIGQGISLCGTWAQSVGLSWLVLQLTHSGTQLGLVIAAQFLPTLLFGIFGGVIADRFNKRHILYCTQSSLGLLALLLGVLVVSHSVQLWMVYAVALGFGLATAVDMPSRQTFIVEMVGGDRLKNAITLNSTVVNLARIIGPSIAAVLIATVGIGPCFLFNGVTFGVVVLVLILMDGSQLRPTERSIRQPGQIRAGIGYAWQTPRLRATLLMMFIIGTFAYEFPVILPLFATITLHGDAATYSAMMAATGIGAVIGGLYSAGRGVASQRLLTITALLFGVSILFVSITPSLVTAFLVLIVVGVLSIRFISLGNTTLQLNSDPQMRGRVMSLWSIAFQGTTPIGGPLIGLIADHSNPRVGLLVGGLATIIASGLGFLVAGDSVAKTSSIKPSPTMPEDRP